MKILNSPPAAIYIIGAGAIDRALAVFLRNAEREVVLIRGSVDELAASTETICVSMPDQPLLTAAVAIKTFSDFGRMEGIVIVTTKSHGNRDIAQKLSSKGTRFPVVLLQNGLNVEQPFIDQRFTQLYRCVLFVTSQFTTGNIIRFKPVAACPVGVIKGDADELAAAVAQIDTPWLRFKPEAAIQPLIWKKVIINCVFNSVCPLLNIDNGIFHRDTTALDIAKRVGSECTEIARLCGVHINNEEVLETLLAISRSSDGQLISTLQDINNKRPTEIDTLNLEISRIAGNLHRDELVMETRLLGQLTALKSNINR
jgi:2-dehydropantoate 2-reductase